MVPPPRFERGTPGLGIRCSILLSYGGTNILEGGFLTLFENRVNGIGRIFLVQIKVSIVVFDNFYF